MTGRGLSGGVPSDGGVVPAGTAGQAPATRHGRQPGVGGTDHSSSGGAAPSWLAADEPAFTTGAAADLLGVQQAFLRQLGSAGLLTPHRSDGGHRRYSRYELDLAARARTLVDEGMALEAACRIVALEVELAAVRAELAQVRQKPHRNR